MKEFTDEELLDINLYLYDETNVVKEKHNIVIIRKPHTCVGCNNEFPTGTRMRCDTWFNKETDKFDTQYYCVLCLVKDEDQDEEARQYIKEEKQASV